VKRSRIKWEPVISTTNIGFIKMRGVALIPDNVAIIL